VAQRLDFLNVISNCFFEVQMTTKREYVNKLILLCPDDMIRDIFTQENS